MSGDFLSCSPLLFFETGLSLNPNLTNLTSLWPANPWVSHLHLPSARTFYMDVGV